MVQRVRGQRGPLSHLLIKQQSDNRGMALTKATWAGIRRLYEAGEAPKTLAERFGVTLRTVKKHARDEGWRVAAPPAASEPPALRESVTSRDQNGVLIRRLYRAISVKLEHMETRMANGETRSAQDEERESRALATMIRNFEKVTEVAADFERAREPGAPETGASAARSRAPDAERMRREIAERLERLNRERDARGDAGEPR